MQIDALERRLQADDRVRLIYVIPNFQNPSGRTWSLERRRRFMEVVNRYRIPVVEDNPYGELRYEGTSLPSLKTFDDDGYVVSLGTFSKIFCPGLRIGWLAAGPSCARST
jgi:2-aminoadipate transaminase